MVSAIMNANIYTECWADSLLIEMLGFKKPNHQFGINEVIKQLLATKANKAIGIIDDDKKKTALTFKDFVLVEEKESMRLLQYQYPSSNKHLILLKPAFEKWVFQQAAQQNVDVTKYGFGRLKDFARSSKSIHVNENQQVKQFLNTIHQKKPAGFIQLKQWILSCK